jgi:hypothetical protein
MTPSVPDRGSGPWVRGWARRGGGQGSALEHPSGCECAPLRRFGAAHQRVHRYLRTSLHNRERCGDQCRVGNPARRVESGSTWYQTGGPVDQVLPWPAPAASEQPGFREAQITLCAEDEMVVHGNVQETPGVDQLPCDGAIIGARGRVPARVVVGHDDARRAEGDGEPEHFARMHEGGVEGFPA